MRLDLLLSLFIHFSKFLHFIGDAALMILERSHEQIHVFESMLGYLLLWLVVVFDFRYTALNLRQIETILCWIQKLFDEQSGKLKNFLRKSIDLYSYGTLINQIYLKL